MLKLEYVAAKLGITKEELNLYINKASIKPYSFSRNNETELYLNNEMIKSIMNLISINKFKKFSKM